MFARMMRVSAKAGKLDEVKRVYEIEIMPLTQKQKGFKSATLLIDRKANAGVSITNWENLAALEASEASGYLKGVLAQLAPHLSGTPVREVYEVAVAK